MPLIYKIVPAALWRKAQDRGRFDGAPIDIEDGYIHFSTAAQVEETAAKHFAGRDDVVLVAVDRKKLGEGLRFEPSRGAPCFRTFMRRCRSTRWCRSSGCRRSRAAAMISPGCSASRQADRPASAGPFGQSLLVGLRRPIARRRIPSHSLMMLEQLKPPPETAFPSPPTGRPSGIRFDFDRGASVTVAAGFGIAAICAYMAWISEPDPAFTVMLLTFGWLAAIVSVLAAELRLGLPVIVLTGLALGFEGAVLIEHSRAPPAPMELSDRDLKIYVKSFAQRIRDGETPYARRFEDIDRRLHNPQLSQEANESAARDSDDYRKLLLEEDAEFKGQYLTQSKNSSGRAAAKIGAEISGRAVSARRWPARVDSHFELMLESGALAGADPLSHVASYLESLADRLP